MVENWVVIVFIGIPLWALLLILITTVLILGKKIDKLSQDLNGFIEQEGRDLIKESKGLLRDSRVVLNRVKVSTQLLPQVTQALSVLSTIKAILDISKKTSAVFKKKGG